MSDSPLSADELEKLKLNELKKLCKKYNLSTSGTKLELIARLVEHKGESFTILQPGEEAKLLGDDVEDEGSSFNLTDSSGALDKSASKSPDVTVDTDQASIPITAPKSDSKIAGVKRPSAVLSTTVEGEENHNQTESDDPKSNSGIHEIKFDSATPPDSEVLAKRANRFGLSRPAGSTTLHDDKLIDRARRFGLPVAQTGTNGTTGAAGSLRAVTGPDTPSATDDEVEKLKKRAERFGEVTSKQMEKLSDAERKAKRLERFGSMGGGQGDSMTPNATVSTCLTSEEAERKAARAAKFGIETDEEKLLKRKARFGLA